MRENIHEYIISLVVCLVIYKFSHISDFKFDFVENKEYLLLRTS